MTPFPARKLSPSGLLAEIRPDELHLARKGTAQTGISLASGAEPGGASDGSDGYTLYIGGEPQSHVFVDHQLHLLFDYLQRIANVVDLFLRTGEPIVALHLGAGALTLPRYIALTRSGSQQFVVESEENLLDFVTENLPLPHGTEFTVRTDDARRGLGWAGEFAPYDLIVSDVYSGSTTPSHLTSVEFYTQVAGLLTFDGILAVNVADDDALTLVRSQTATMADVFDHVVVLGPTDLLTGRGEGNAVLLGSRAPGILNLLSRLSAEGPHPSTIIEPDGLRAFIGDARAVTDAGQHG